MSDFGGRVLVHQVAAGYGVSEAVAARAVRALFGEAIFEALKAEGVRCGQTESVGAGVASGRGRAVGQGGGAVCALPHGAAQIQDGERSAGRPGGGQVVAFVRPQVAAGR